MPATSTFPEPAVDWIGGEPARDIAVIGPTRETVRGLVAAGHRVTAISRSLVALQRIAAGHLPVTCIAAAAEALPFEPQTFDTVVCLQNLHQMVPETAMSEFARALRPGGSLVVVYTTRDDTVPWVRRLAAVLQAVDPQAMKGDYGVESVRHLEESHYFPQLESRSFRTWVPIERRQLLSMVERRGPMGELAPERREKLLADVGAIYDSMARAPQPLLLPYQATCWRGYVDQDELSIPIRFEDALRIL